MSSSPPQPSPNGQFHGGAVPAQWFPVASTSAGAAGGVGAPPPPAAPVSTGVFAAGAGGAPPQPQFVAPAGSSGPTAAPAGVTTVNLMPVPMPSSTPPNVSVVRIVEPSGGNRGGTVGDGTFNSMHSNASYVSTTSMPTVDSYSGGAGVLRVQDPAAAGNPSVQSLPAPSLAGMAVVGNAPMPAPGATVVQVLAPVTSGAYAATAAGSPPLTQQQSQSPPFTQPVVYQQLVPAQSMSPVQQQQQLQQPVHVQLSPQPLSFVAPTPTDPTPPPSHLGVAPGTPSVSVNPQGTSPNVPLQRPLKLLHQQQQQQHQNQQQHQLVQQQPLTAPPPAPFDAAVMTAAAQQQQQQQSSEPPRLVRMTGQGDENDLDPALFQYFQQLAPRPVTSVPAQGANRMPIYSAVDPVQADTIMMKGSAKLLLRMQSRPPLETTHGIACRWRALVYHQGSIIGSCYAKPIGPLVQDEPVVVSGVQLPVNVPLVRIEVEEYRPKGRQRSFKEERIWNIFRAALCHIPEPVWRESAYVVVGDSMFLHAKLTTAMRDVTSDSASGVDSAGRPLTMHDGEGAAQIVSIEAAMAIRSLFNQFTSGLVAV